MKKQTTKLVGVCAAALLTIGAVTPATATIFGDNGVASAAEFGANWLAKNVKWDQGTFSQAQYQSLVQFVGTNDLSGTAVTSDPLLAKLFPGFDGTVAGLKADTVLDALGLGEYSGDYTVSMDTSLPAGITWYELNQRTQPFTITFKLTSVATGKTDYSFTTNVTIAQLGVKAENIVANLGDVYEITDGVSVTGLNGEEYTYVAGDKPANPMEYTISEVAIPGNFVEADYTAANEDGDKGFIKTTSGIVQKLSIKYMNEVGTVVEKIVERTITVNATAQTTPLLALQNPLENGPETNGLNIAFYNGAKIPENYALLTYSQNNAPLEGTVAWIKANVWGETGTYVYDAANTSATADVAKVDNTQNTGLTLVPLGGSLFDYKTAAEFFYDDEMLLNKNHIEITDASNVDLTTPGTYYYTVKLTNKAGVSSTFEMPIIVKQSDNAPFVSYEIGYSKDMTIKVGDSFSPFDGITFWENQAEKDNNGKTIPLNQITVKGSVNTNVAGTYTLTYTATNSIGKTTTISRTITVTDGTVQKDIPVYRLYNAGNGHHMFTKSFDEYTWLKTQGWTQEGMAWESPAEGNPVYRLYNATTGEHLFTMDIGEYNWLATQGWTQEGVSFYSAPAATGNPVYRLYNPITGLHFYTQSEKEYNWLPSQGWKQEGPAFYGVGK